MDVFAEIDNGKYVCFYAVSSADPAVTAVVASARIQGIDNTLPTITVDVNPAQGTLANSRTFTAMVSDATPYGLTDAVNPITTVYQIITPPNSADSPTCPDAPVGRTTPYTAAGVTFSSDADVTAGKWVCFWATDTATNRGKAASPKVQNLDTTPPTVTVEYGTFIHAVAVANAHSGLPAVTTAVAQTITYAASQPSTQTRNRLVRATASDLNSIQMWSKVQDTAACGAVDKTTSYGGSGDYDTMTDIFTGPVPVVVAENGKYVCFWAQDAAGNVAGAVSVRTSGVVGPPTIVVDSRGNQYIGGLLIVANSRSYSATSSFNFADGSTKWFIGREDTPDACRAATLTDYYLEGIVASTGHDSSNGKFICFGVDDDRFNSDGTPNSERVIDASFRVLGIDHTAPVITVVDPTSQANLAKSRTFTASYTDEPVPASGVRNIIEFKYKLTAAAEGETVPTTPTVDNNCAATPPSDAISYSNNDPIEYADEDHNNKWLCFWATDEADNVGRAVSAKIVKLDTREPQITITFQVLDHGETPPSTVTFTDLESGQGQTHTRNRFLKATAEDASTITMWYEILSLPAGAAPPPSTLTARRCAQASSPTVKQLATTTRTPASSRPRRRRRWWWAPTGPSSASTPRTAPPATRLTSRWPAPRQSAASSPATTE